MKTFFFLVLSVAETSPLDLSIIYFLVNTEKTHKIATTAGKTAYMGLPFCIIMNAA
jgi:hypothetical protein